MFIAWAVIMVKITRKNPKFVKDLLKRYQNEAVLAIGYPANTKAVGIKYPDGTPVVLVAAVNNFGSASRGIPARPFMQLGQEPALKAVEPIAKALVPLLNEGKLTIADMLEDMGAPAVAEFKQAITDLKTPANAPSTIARKGSSNPLVDTGLLRSSLTYAVRKP